MSPRPKFPKTVLTNTTTSPTQAGWWSELLIGGTVIARKLLPFKSIRYKPFGWPPSAPAAILVALGERQGHGNLPPLSMAVSLKFTGLKTSKPRVPNCVLSKITISGVLERGLNWPG